MEKAPKFSYFRNASLISFLNNVVSICKKFDIEALKIATEVATIVADVQSLEKLFAVTKKNSNTSILKELDAQRGAAVVAIQGISQLYLKHYDGDYRQAAKLVQNVFAKYDKHIELLVYGAETAAIQSLVNDLLKDSTRYAALQKLSLVDWVQELKRVNEAFNAVYLQRNKELSELPSDRIKDRKATVIANYKQFIKVLKAFNTLHPSGDYERILKAIAELITKYNVGIGTRLKKVEERKDV